MSCKKLSASFVATFLFSVSAHAEEPGFFAGLDVTGGMASGSSSTTNGGAPAGGGGTVDNVEFGATLGVGGHVGYRINQALSVALAYQHISGDVSWDARFAVGGASRYEGTATGDAIAANVAYDMALSDAVVFRPNLGLGMTFNTFSDVVERDIATGGLVSYVEDNTEISPMVRIGLGLQYKLAPNASLNLDTSLAYTGGFQTGNTRSGNAGTTGITPYEIEDVWRASLGASLQLEF